jgi:hypothetical protein
MHDGACDSNGACYDSSDAQHRADNWCGWPSSSEALGSGTRC